MNGKTNKNKGHNAERYYCNIFRELGFSFCTTARLGSRLYDNCKIDLINLPFNVQIKAGKQKNMNPGKELLAMAQMIELSFPPEESIHSKPAFLIHKKDVGRGNKRTPKDELVWMSYEQFLKFKEQLPKLRYLHKKEHRYVLNSQFKVLVCITFETFVEQIINKIFKENVENNK